MCESRIFDSRKFAYTFAFAESAAKSIVESNRNARQMIRLDSARAATKSAGLSLFVQGRQTVTPAGGTGMRCPRAKGSSPLHSGGIGHHVRRHYDRRGLCLITHDST